VSNLISEGKIAKNRKKPMRSIAIFSSIPSHHRVTIILFVCLFVCYAQKSIARSQTFRKKILQEKHDRNFLTMSITYSNIYHNQTVTFNFKLAKLTVN